MNVFRSLKWRHGLIGILSLNLSSCYMNGLTHPFATEEPAYQNTVISNDGVNTSRIYRPNDYTGNGYTRGYAPRAGGEVRNLREVREVRRARKVSHVVSENNPRGPTDGPKSTETIKPSKIPVM